MHRLVRFQNLIQPTATQWKCHFFIPGFNIGGKYNHDFFHFERCGALRFIVDRMDQERWTEMWRLMVVVDGCCDHGKMDPVHHQINVIFHVQTFSVCISHVPGRTRIVMTLFVVLLLLHGRQQVSTTTISELFTSGIDRDTWYRRGGLSAVHGTKHVVR